MKVELHTKAAIVLFFVLCTFISPSFAIEGLKNGIVKITATTFEGMDKVGTGFIVQFTQDIAYIVTASHVVEGDKQPGVEFFTRRNAPVTASVVGLEGGDPKGLAVLLVRGAENLPPGLSALPLAPSLQLKDGDEITVIGFPRLVGPWSVITGNIVSRKGRDIIFDGAIDEGNSGGPMIKKDQVTGLVTEVSQPYGYATPASSVQLFWEGWGVEITQLQGSENNTLEALSPEMRKTRMEAYKVISKAFDDHLYWTEAMHLSFRSEDATRERRDLDVTEYNKHYENLMGEKSAFIENPVIHVIC